MMAATKRASALVAIALVGCLCQPATAQTESAGCDPPSARGDGWEIAAPDSVALDGQLLCSAMERMRRIPGNNVHAVLVARHGKLVFEQYFTGPDERWGSPIGQVAFGPEVKHDLRSITKS